MCLYQVKGNLRETTQTKRQNQKNKMLYVEDRTTDSAGVNYNIVFQNNSTNNWNFLCFQNQPSGLPSNYQTLAWFSKAAAPTTKIVFSWSIDYSFVWGEVGNLVPGVIFNASQTVDADLSTTNAIDFTRTSTGAFDFQNQGQGPNAGTLTINEDGTIPLNTASVGVGMSGFGTFAVPAQPNITATFQPTPTYYVAFSQNIQQGEVMDITQITSEMAEVQFPVNVTTMYATLGADNKWTISQQSSADDLLGDLRKNAITL